MRDIVTGYAQESRSSTNRFISLLIVDDYEITRSAMAHLITLKLPDATLHVADNYASSVELCARHNIDIVITDMKRASLRVHDIFDRITSANRDIQLILLTGSSDKEDMAVIARMNNVSLLEKPVDFSELLNVIHSLAQAKQERMLSV